LCGFYEDPIWNGLAPNQVFNAVPSPPFSAAAELAALRHPRRPTSSGSLEGQLGKAKPSMVASAIPDRPFKGFVTYSSPTQNGRDSSQYEGTGLVVDYSKKGWRK
jgi:hypothetical protein